MSKLKFKKSVHNVERIRGDIASRYDKLRLDKNERVSYFPEDVFNDWKNSIRQEWITAYPETEAFYNQLAVHHKTTPDKFFITTGADGAIKNCFELFVEPNRKVIVVEPTFAMVDVYCRLFEANKISISYDSALNLNTQLLLESITEDISLIIIANPNSPTGTILDDESIFKILDLANLKNVPVLIDEAYYGFSKYTAEPLLERFDNLLIARTFSKAFGLAGMRIGYVYSSSEIISKMYKFRPMYEVNSFALHFASYLLDHTHLVDDYLRQTEAGSEVLRNFLKANQIRFINTHTNFIHVDFGDRYQTANSIFENFGILVRGGLPLPGYESFLRLSTGPVAAMEQLLVALKEIFQKK